MRPSRSLAGSRPLSPARVAGGGLAALAVAMGIGRFAFTPILPMMQADLGLSVAAGGWLAAANYAGYLVGALSAMALRLRPTTAIRAALAVVGLATLAMAGTTHFALWVLLRAIAGVASAWLLVFASAWCLERLTPLGRPLLPSAVFAGVGVGIAVAGICCAALMRAEAGAPAAWGLLGVIALGATALLWPLFAGEGSPAAPAAARRASRDRLWGADAIRLVLCYGTLGLGYIIPATFIPAMAREIVRDPAVFGLAWPVFGAAAAASTPVAALLARALPGRRIWALSHLVLAAGVACPVVWPGIAGIIAAALLVGGTFMVATMTGMQEARRVGGASATVLMAALTSAFALGQIIGPLAVSALLAARLPVSGALLGTAALLVASAVLLAWSSPPAPGSSQATG